MKRIYAIFTAVMLATWLHAEPIPGCIEPDSIVYLSSLCPSEDIFELRHGGQLIRTFTPEVPGIFTLADTFKMKEGVCDSLIIEWKITVLPSYVIEIPIYIPIGKTSIIWEHDNLEHKEGDVVTDSLQSTEGCDSIQIYRFIKETASGYCGAEGDGTNLAWYISEDSLLVISGSGAMANYYKTGAPWYDYRYAIKDIFFPEELTSIGNYAFYDCYNLLTVSIPPAVTSIGSGAFDECWKLYYVNTPSLEAWCNINFADTAANPTCMSHKLYLDGPQIEYLVIPPTITTIKDNAFVRCDFKKVTLHANVMSIGFAAFENCNEMDTMVCYATTPPELTYGHLGYLLNTVLSVPQASIDAYKAISGYANAFKDIIGFASEVTDITATTAKIEWIPNPDVTQYLISVYTSDTLFAQYIVDGEGNVTDTVKSAMVAKIRKKKLDSRETFTISIGGLTANTTYSYSIEGRDEQQQTIYHEEGHFQTADMDEGLFDFIATEQERVRKTVMDGKMVILRGDHVFDVQGKMVK